MDPATQAVLVGGIIAAVMALIAMANLVLMFWLNSIKERRVDERQRLAEERSDERARQLVGKVDEVKIVAEDAAKAAGVVAKNTSVETVAAIKNQTVELKEAIKTNGGEMSASPSGQNIVEAPVTVVLPKDRGG